MRQTPYGAARYVSYFWRRRGIDTRLAPHRQVRRMRRPIDRSRSIECCDLAVWAVLKVFQFAGTHAAGLVPLSASFANVVKIAPASTLCSICSGPLLAGRGRSTGSSKGGRRVDRDLRLGQTFLWTFHGRATQGLSEASCTSHFCFRLDVSIRGLRAKTLNSVFHSSTLWTLRPRARLGNTLSFSAATGVTRPLRRPGRVLQLFRRSRVRRPRSGHRR